MCGFIVAIQHESEPGCSALTIRCRASSCAAAAISVIARRRNPRKAQTVALVARDHVQVEVKDGLEGDRAAGVQQVLRRRRPAGP